MAHFSSVLANSTVPATAAAATGKKITFLPDQISDMEKETQKIFENVALYALYNRATHKLILKDIAQNRPKYIEAAKKSIRDGSHFGAPKGAMMDFYAEELVKYLIDRTEYNIQNMVKLNYQRSKYD